MSEGFRIRRVDVDDVATVARHRARMFEDMGRLPRALHEEYLRQNVERLRGWVASGEYVGWLVSPEGDSKQVVAGAGVQLRRALPSPRTSPTGEVTLADGRQALVINVFTERAWRRRGLSTLVMRHVIAWCREQGIESIVLHASDEGRPVYEKLGFAATNEMRLRVEPPLPACGAP
jgi:GNAT superfamily N-acetyltransferase